MVPWKPFHMELIVFLFKELNLPEEAGSSSNETKMELVESCWSKDQLLTMADLGNWTSEFCFYLCFLNLLFLF